MKERFDIRDGLCYGYEGECEHLVIPEGVIGIWEEAFAERDELKKVTMPRSLKFIGGQGFSPLQKFGDGRAERRSGRNQLVCL